MSRARNRSLERLLEVYDVLLLLGRASSRKLAEFMGLSQRTVERYLRLLVKGGYVSYYRDGRRLIYRVERPFTEDDARRLLGMAVPGEDRGEADVYRLARRIVEIAGRARLHADLIGTAKIHLEVPSHNSVTHTVEVVVAGEHAAILAALLRYGLGLIPRGASGDADYRFQYARAKVKVKVMVDGLKEDGRLVWNLEPDLRRGKLTLEHAVITVLARRNFEERMDTYDVAIALPHIDEDRLRRILETVPRTLKERIAGHLRLVEEYIRVEFNGPEQEHMLRKLHRISKTVSAR